MLRICDLPPLHDILDELIAEEDGGDDDKYMVDMYEHIFYLIDECLLENPTEVSEPDFEDWLFDELLDLLEIMFENTNIYEVEELIEYAIEQYFDTVYPPRSYIDSIIIETHIIDVERTQQQIDYLHSKPQPAQRTPEWYAFRRQLITASNAYKAFESQSMQNQLIYEKCNEPIDIKMQGPEQKQEQKQVNTTSSLHWGQKYEPLSVLLYEHIYNTVIADFGCIQHDTYPFIGASPDGINVAQTSPRFGRMLEIKNVVSREIDGIPKKEYWIQMQLQMETCDLDECDFLETQFKEYETYAEFMADEVAQYKGVIMQFATATGNPKYIYAPVCLSLLELEEWELRTRASIMLEWTCNCYWKIEKLSCVLVPRNRQWFQSNVKVLGELWDTVLKERISGYEHRAPNKRATITEEDEDDVVDTNGCLFLVNSVGKIV